MLLFNFTQWNTNNTPNEYKYLTIFILHKAGLTDFKSTIVAPHASFSEEYNAINKLKYNHVSRVNSPEKQWNVDIYQKNIQTL